MQTKHQDLQLPLIAKEARGSLVDLQSWEGARYDRG